MKAIFFGGPLDKEIKDIVDGCSEVRAMKPYKLPRDWDSIPATLPWDKMFIEYKIKHICENVKRGKNYLTRSWSVFVTGKWRRASAKRIAARIKRLKWKPHGEYLRDKHGLVIS